LTYRIGNDEKVPQSRLTIIAYLIVGITLLLLLGFWKLQLLDTQRYVEMAERNRIRSIPLIAPRGRMLDREGRILLDNYPSFSILLLRDSPEQVQQDLPRISPGLDLPLEDLAQQVEAARGLPRFQPIVIKSDATQADLAFVESHRADLSCLELLMVYRRKYPPNGFLAHVLGHVGEVTPRDIAQNPGRYRPGDIVGKSGVEREYNETLMGFDGLRRVVVDSRGQVRGTLEEVDASPGKPIRLTIDYDLQTIAQADLAGKKGAIVALNPQTGEVLAMAGSPAPDPNEFADGMSRAEWEEMNNDPDRPLLNRAIQAQLAPGSVFKIVMAVAMLESKVIPPDFVVSCHGSAEFYGRTFHCWEKGGHGVVDLHKAIVHSCDVFFYNVGKRLGIDRIAYYAYELGLGHRSGIDLPGEEPGLIPSEPWKENHFRQKWFPGETISVAVGQGAITVTPLQLAYSIGGIALGGVFKRPHVLLGSDPTPEIRFPLSESTTQRVVDAMFGVVNEGGTAASSHLEGIEFCGKTGSAQVISEEGLKRVKGNRRFEANAWFVGFAPRHNPEIVVSVLVERGVHGASSAAPIARDIIKAYYDKKNLRQQEQYTAEKAAGTHSMALQARAN